jgi:hypothetical protein
MNFSNTFLVVLALLLIASAFGQPLQGQQGGYQNVTLRSALDYPVDFLVDGVLQCHAPAKGTCSARIGEGNRVFAAAKTDGIGKIVKSEKIYVFGDMSSAVWNVLRADD